MMVGTSATKPFVEMVIGDPDEVGIGQAGQDGVGGGSLQGQLGELAR